jgi:acyl-CoA synthetase (NDP forming)
MSVKKLIDAIRKKKKTSINEGEAKALLKEFGVPVVPEAAASDAQEAVVKRPSSLPTLLVIRWW